MIPGPITTLAIPESSVNFVHTTNLYAGDYEQINGTSYYYMDGGVIYVKPATGAGQAYYALTDHLGSYTRLYRFHLGSHVFISWFWSTSSWHEQYISMSINNRCRNCYVWIVRRWMDRRSHAGI